MTAWELWQEFCLIRDIDINTEHDEWAFCGGGPEADELGILVLEGKKFGTASLYEEYSKEEEPLPKVGSYSVLLDQYDNAYAVIKETDVTIKPFGQISDYHGYSEGEEERNLAAWRRIHEHYWKNDVNRMKISFSMDTPVVAEKFTVEYVAPDQRLIPGVSGEDLYEECFLIEPAAGYAGGC